MPAGGVPAGASRPNQAPISIGVPCSVMVGTSGSTDDALLGRDAERAHAAGLDRPERERHHVEHHVDVAGGEVLRRRRRALVGHVRDVDAGLQLEQLARDVAGGADALRRIGQLAGIGLGVGDQLLDRFRRHRRMHHQDVRHRDARASTGAKPLSGS